jgi:hypothetical protein
MITARGGDKPDALLGSGGGEPHSADEPAQRRLPLHPAGDQESARFLAHDWPGRAEEAIAQLEQLGVERRENDSAAAPRK